MNCDGSTPIEITLRTVMKKPGHRTPNDTISINRRTFVKFLPAAGAAGLAVANAPLKALAQTPTPAASPTPVPSPTPEPRISKEVLRNAEKVIGVDFTDAQLELVRPGASRALDSYEVVRKMDVPLDTEPAV